MLECIPCAQIPEKYRREFERALRDSREIFQRGKYPGQYPGNFSMRNSSGQFAYAAYERFAP